MNTSQLLCMLHDDSVLNASVLGVYAADQVPQYIHRGGFIANTDVSSKPEKHWCAFYFNGSGQSEFFDSYARPPNYYSDSFASCLRNNSVVQLYNGKQLQSNSSNVCGQFCVYFLTQRVRGQIFRDILERLQSIEQRDQYVYDFIASSFPYCVTNVNSRHNQSCVCLNKV